MNTILLNTVALDDGKVIRKGGSGGGGGVTINNQSKSVDIVENGTTEIVADSGYTGLGKVTINTNVASSGGGAVAASPKDVNFRDYDGTILYSFSKADFLALTELPPLPTQKGLTCQGWNYTIADAQSYVTNYGKLEVGAMYITDDGKTRLYIRIADIGRMDVPLYISLTSTNGVTIDWGDGSATEKLGGSGYQNVNTTHHYNEIGDYVISLDVADGDTLGLGYNSSTVMGSTENNGKVYCNMLQRAEIGKGVTSLGGYAFNTCCSLASVVIPEGVTSIGENAFKNCYSLSSVVIPQGVTSIGSNAFRTCYSLSSVVIPQGVTSIGASAFYNCYSLASVVIPQGVTSIGSNAFYSCYSLSSVVIPQGVTSIENSAFQICSSIAYFDFRSHTSVPTLSNYNAFTSIATDCKIVVPDSLYDSWISATNWSNTNVAKYIIKASEFNG